MKEEYKYMVFTSCATYNHEAYIVDAMKGFTMQQTTFPVVYCIIDDASTDNNANVIESYVRQNFTFDVSDAYEKDEEYGHEIFARHKKNENCWFAVVLLKENHYSKKKSKVPYLNKWRSKAKYYAICEGDDYWTDPNKLQKQVEVLESHPDCTMVCNRTKLLSVRQNKFIGEQYCLCKNGWLNPVDIINRTGLYISTCSIIYRLKFRDEYPDYCKQCLVGDYPLQIFFAMKGKVGYIDDAMSVYRVQNSESWMGQQEWGRMSENRIKVIKSQVEMFLGFSNDYPLYKKVLMYKISDHINRNIPKRPAHTIQEQNDYLAHFSEYIKKYAIRSRIDLWIRKSGSWHLRNFYKNHFLNKYYSTIYYY